MKINSTNLEKKLKFKFTDPKILIKIFGSENFNFNFFSNVVGLIFIK